MKAEFVGLAGAFLTIFTLSTGCSVAQESQPATVAEAAAVLDLTKFSPVDPANENGTMVVASQSYSSTATVSAAAKKVQQQFLQAGWKELDGSTFTDQYASATFQKSGFTVSVSVMPGNASAPSTVNINNHGNVNLKTLPKPAGAIEVYAFPTSIMLMTDASVDETGAQYKKLFAENGWELFGETTVSFFVKKNAVLLQVMVSSAPAQQGKTTIQITSNQMSVDLPAPPDVEGLQYSDTSGQLSFDSAKTQTEWVDWFKNKLGETGWKATTENPLKIDFREYLIFRNPAEELIEVSFSKFEEKTRINVQYQTAAQVAEEDRKAKEFAAKKLAENAAEQERKMNPEKISIVAPVGATAVAETPKQIEFSTASGTAKAALATWLVTWESEGWALKKIADENQLGEYELTKGETRISAGFVDPGFIPGSITVTLNGDLQLELKK